MAVSDYKLEIDFNGTIKTVDLLDCNFENDRFVSWDYFVKEPKTASVSFFHSNEIYEIIASKDNFLNWNVAEDEVYYEDVYKEKCRIYRRNLLVFTGYIRLPIKTDFITMEVNLVDPLYILTSYAEIMGAGGKTVFYGDVFDELQERMLTLFGIDLEIITDEVPSFPPMDWVSTVTPNTVEPSRYTAFLSFFEYEDKRLPCIYIFNNNNSGLNRGLKRAVTYVFKEDGTLIDPENEDDENDESIGEHDITHMFQERHLIRHSNGVVTLNPAYFDYYGISEVNFTHFDSSGGVYATYLPVQTVSKSFNLDLNPFEDKAYKYRGFIKWERGTLAGGSIVIKVSQLKLYKSTMSLPRVESKIKPITNAMFPLYFCAYSDYPNYKNLLSTYLFFNDKSIYANALGQIRIAELETELNNVMTPTEINVNDIVTISTSVNAPSKSEFESLNILNPITFTESLLQLYNENAEVYYSNIKSKVRFPVEISIFAKNYSLVRGQKIKALNNIIYVNEIDNDLGVYKIKGYII